MLLAWAILVPSGIVVARYFKHIGHAWYVAHASLQMVAMLISVASFAYVVYNKYPNISVLSTNPVVVAHAVFGFTVVPVGAVVMPVLGKLADLYWRADRTSTPVFPDRIHWYLGRLLYVMALCNVIMGFLIYQAVWLILVLIITLIFGAFVGFLERRRVPSQAHGK